MATSRLQDSDFVELHRRLVVLRVGLLLVVALLALRLWHLQIREGPYYRDLSENNRTRSVILEPARGLIYALNTFLFALLLGIAYALIFRAAIRREQKAAKAAA